MILFAALTIKNIQHSRNRVLPTATQPNNPTSAVVRKRDKNLFKLVITEIIISTICTFPYTIDTIYFVLTSNIPDKSIERLQIESFFVFFTTTLLLYLKYSTTFYAYLATSKVFRAEVKIILLKTVTTILGTVNDELGTRAHPPIAT
jgi:hypothetical protein